MRKLCGVLIGVLTLGQIPRAAETAAHEVKVGGQTLVIPAPQGFERSDGVFPEYDELSAKSIAPTNRYVIWFQTPEAVASLRAGRIPSNGRKFNAQTLRNMEHQRLSQSQFESKRAESEADLDRLGKRLDAVLGKVVAAGSKSLSDQLRKNVEVKLGEPVPLGIFERTRDSLGFSMLIKTSTTVAGQDTPDLSVVALMMVRVRDRLLCLYATSERKSEADEVWARSEVLKWRDAIFAANGQTDAPASSAASRVLRLFDFQRILTLAAVGVVIALIARLIRRPKHPNPPVS
jgi:hypothetical protein